jgi:hypothetical protein
MATAFSSGGFTTTAKFFGRTENSILTRRAKVRFLTVKRGDQPHRRFGA